MPGQKAVLHLTVRVEPRASECRVVGFDEAGRLKVRVTAAPTDGKANDAVVEVLARALGIPRRQVVIERGHASRTKTVRIVGLSEGDVKRRIAGAS